MRASTDDLKRSRFLAQKDVEPPVLVTIIDTEEINVAVEGAEPNMERILHFKELEKPLILKPTNGEIIKAVMGSKYYDDWVGRQIVLFVEPNVFFAGKRTGGIRCRAPRNQPAQNISAEEAAAQEVVDDIAEDPRNPHDDVPF